MRHLLISAEFGLAFLWSVLVQLSFNSAREVDVGRFEEHVRLRHIAFTLLLGPVAQ